ncbi:MAG: primary replicative helicase [Myxococcaceae bacterium]|nr:primary replicative helicase [Myxococcaceae bacterium]
MSSVPAEFVGGRTDLRRAPRIDEVDADERLVDEHLERDALCAAIIYGRDFVEKSALQTGDFWGTSHQRIMSAVLHLIGEGDAVDSFELIRRLDEAGTLRGVGGREYILDLTATKLIPPASLQTKGLRVLARQRAMKEAARGLHVAFDRGDDTAPYLATIDRARAELAEIESGGTKDSTPVYQPLAMMIEHALRPVGARLQTGFSTLDVATRGGLPIGRVVVLAGAPGAAKTTLAVYLMNLWEQAGCACVYLAADEPAEGIITRLGQLAEFSREALESDGPAGDGVRASFARAAAGRAMAVIDPDADESMRSIEDAERALLHLAGDRPRVLIADSLQTLFCAAAADAESVRERTDIKIATTKAIAKRGTLVVLISEMSRAGYRSGQRSENISALAASKESGSIEYGASLLLGLRSVAGESGLVDVEVAKNRLGGSKPELRLKLDFERASFEEVELPAGEQCEVSSKKARASALRESVLTAVRSQPLVSATEIYRVVKGTKSDVLDEVRDLKAKGMIVQVQGVFRVAADKQEERHV